MTNTYEKQNMAHYLTRVVIMPDHFDLFEDYENPRTYRAIECTNTERILSMVIRVKVDHNETATATPGTGDTCVVRV